MKGRRNLMNGLGEVGCVYVCMYVCMYVCSARVELLWFQSGFRVVSDPSGGLADLDERNNLQTEKT